MGFFDLLGVYFWGIVYAFFTCGVFYLSCESFIRLFPIDEYRFIAGVVGIIVGLLIVTIPDVWQLIVNWWAEAPPDLWAHHAEEGMTNGQIGTLIFWKFIAGLGGGVGGWALMREFGFD